MYAIVSISGKQYRVSEGERIRLPSLDSPAGEVVQFDTVLLTDNAEKVVVGTPLVSGARVSARVLEHGRNKKITIYKKKRRTGYQRKKGHRQGYTLVEIEKIQPAGEKPKTPPKKTRTTKPKGGENKVQSKKNPGPTKAGSASAEIRAASAKTETDPAGAGPGPAGAGPKKEA